MKRIQCLLLAAALLLTLVGCTLSHKPEHPVRFYFLRAADRYEYGSVDGVVTYEERDAAGYERDLRYLLTLYLQGPVDEGLRSPFPADCRLLTMSCKDGDLTL